MFSEHDLLILFFLHSLTCLAKSAHLSPHALRSWVLMGALYCFLLDWRRHFALRILSEDGWRVSVSVSIDEKAQERQILCCRKEVDTLRAEKGGPGDWSKGPVVELTLQRPEAGGLHTDGGSQCLAGTLLRTWSGAKEWGQQSVMFFCLFVLFKIPLAVGLEKITK